MTIILERNAHKEDLVVPLSATGWMFLVHFAHAMGWDMHSATHGSDGHHPTTCFDHQCAAAFARALRLGIPDISPMRSDDALRAVFESISATIEGDTVTLEDRAVEKLQRQMSSRQVLFQVFGGCGDWLARIAAFAEGGPFQVVNTHVLL